MSRGSVGKTSRMNLESVQDGPYELPEGWVWTPLGEAIEFNYGKGLPARRRNVSGGVSVYGSNGVVGRHDKALTSSPVLIVGRKGSVGEVHLSSAPCWPIDTTYFVDRFPSGLDPTFLFRYLRSQRLRDLDRSTAVPGINREDLYRLSIPLPPLNEQQRIVAKVEALFEQSRTARQALDRIPPLLKKFRQSVLAAAFRGDLTRDWRESRIADLRSRIADFDPDKSTIRNPQSEILYEPASALLERIRTERRRKWEEGLRAKGKDPRKVKFEEPEPVDTSDLPGLPEGWVWVQFGGLISFVTSGSRGWAKYYSDNGPIFLRVGNLDHDSISLDLAQVIRVRPPNGAEGTRTKVEPGDILVSITADVGMVAVAPENIEEAYINQHVALARPLRGLSVSYLAYYFASQEGGQKQFTEMQYGMTKTGLNLANVQDVRIPFAPLSEQRRVVARIEEMFAHADTIEITVDAARQQAKKLEQSILARAFRGELVPQDPDDEPASVFLDRIRAERMRSSIGKGPTVSRRKGRGPQNGN